MLKITQFRSYKNYKPMQIVNVPKKGKAGDLYNVLGQDGNVVGRFEFASDGEVCDLFLDKSIRRKQASVNALFSVLDFVIDLAKKKKLDVIRFCAKKNSKNHTERLYSKVTPYEENHLLGKWFSLPVTKEGEKVLKQRQEELEFFPNLLDCIFPFSL